MLQKIHDRFTEEALDAEALVQLKMQMDTVTGFLGQLSNFIADAVHELDTREWEEETNGQ